MEDRVRYVTRRRVNGSCYRVAVPTAKPLRCPHEHAWLQATLERQGLKAYSRGFSVTDPKQRRVQNEVRDWCRGDEYTLWSRRECRYLTARDNPAVISKAKGSSQWLPSPADFLTPFIGIY